MRHRNLTGSCTRSRLRALSRVRIGLLMFAGGLEPQLALADTSAARAELSAIHPEPVPAEPRGAPLELRVSYRAPRECPSSSDFLAALQQHVAAGGSGAIDADVSIRRASASEFELVLRLRVEGQASERTTRAEACLPLMQLAALDASMARTMSPEERAALAAPAPPFAIEPSPRLEASAPLEAPATEAVGPEPATTGSARSPGRPWGTRAFVLGELRTVSGLLPRPAWGRGIGAGIAHDVVSLRVSATLWQGQRGVFAPDGTSPMHLDFDQSSLHLSPCAGRALSSVLRLDGCASIAAHRIDTDAEDARTYASLGAAALATLSPWRGLRIEFEGGLSAGLQRPSFGAERVRYLYEPEVLQPSARFALGWDFGGGT